MKLFRPLLDNIAKKEILKLESEIEALEKKIEFKDKYIRELKDTIASQREKIKELDSKVSKWINWYVEKEHELEELKKPKAKKSSKPKSPTHRIEELQTRQLSPDAKGQDLESCMNSDTIFYNKKIVITGIFCLYPDREELAMLLKDYGADIKSSVSSKTNIVIMGSDAGPKKQERIIEINHSGGNIKVINEFELYQILDEIEKNGSESGQRT